jgi:hypothetical protein
MARIDHTNCSHPRTPAGRRACRTGHQSEIPPVVRRGVRGDDGMTVAERARNARANRNRADAAAGRMARRRERAGVQGPSDDYSSCVQAALHTGTGRCACGWHTKGF